MFFVLVVSVAGLLASGTVQLTVPPTINHNVVETRMPADTLGFND